MIKPLQIIRMNILDGILSIMGLILLVQPSQEVIVFLFFLGELHLKETMMIMNPQPLVSSGDTELILPGD